MKKLSKRLSTRSSSGHVDEVGATVVSIPDGSPLVKAIIGAGLAGVKSFSSEGAGSVSSRDAEFRMKLLEETRKVEAFFVSTVATLEDNYTTLKSQVRLVAVLLKVFVGLGVGHTPQILLSLVVPDATKAFLLLLLLQLLMPFFLLLI